MYTVENVVPAIVADFGSHTSKVGYAGDDLPQLLFRSRLGIKEDAEAKSYICGDELLHPRDGYDVASPFDEHALVKNWGDMEKLMDYALRRIKADEFGFMVAEPTYNPRDLREKMCELTFETYGAPAVYLGRSAVLSAIANNRTTGVVLDIGASCVTAVPVFEGAVVKNKVLGSAGAGAALTEAVHKQLQEKDIKLRPGYSVRKRRVDADDDGEAIMDDDAGAREYEVEDVPTKTTDSYRRFCETMLVEQVKEAICKVNDSPMAEPILQPTESYELPDGTIVEMGLEKHNAPESLFGALTHVAALGGAQTAPAGGTSTSEGISGLVYDVIQQCDAHMQKDMYVGVCLTGGTSIFPGLYERLTRDLLLRHNKVRVLAATGSPERRYCAWTGGSILATFSEFQKMWLSKEEYEENGASFVHKKCP